MPFIFYILFIICTSFVFKTNDVPIHIEFKDKDSYIKVDGFKNIYVINDMEIIKYNATGELQKTFSMKRYGKIEFVDVANPLKILVYYKDFQQLVFLDNQLTASSNLISLEKIGLEQASLICTSTNNSFWLFDKQNNALIRFNDASKTLVKTGNLKRILDTEINPNFMQEHNGYLYLNCPTQGILVFDFYGTFYKTLPLKALKEFNIVNGNVFYFKNDTLNEFQPATFYTVKKAFTKNGLKNVLWQNNTFYKIYSDSVIVQ